MPIHPLHRHERVAGPFGNHANAGHRLARTRRRDAHFMSWAEIPPPMATAAVALSLVLGGCGGGSGSTMTEPDPMTMTMPMSETDSGSVMLTQVQHDELLKVLPKAGASATVNVAAGGAEMRAGVTFTCASAYPCTVTLTNSLGTIVATWQSRKLPDGMAGVTTMGHEPPHGSDPLAELNEAGANAIANIISVAIDAPEVTTPGSEAPRGAYSGANNALGGLVYGGDGAINLSRVTLTSSLDPNTASYTPATPTDDAMGGSTLMAMNTDGTWADYDEDAPNSTVALEGWNHTVLFRDWGDTAGIEDGGYETGALIYSGVTAPTEVPLESEAAAPEGLLVYGAWLTTPNKVGGEHRAGVFFGGMNIFGGTNTYGTDNNAFVAGDDNGLRGTATYSGGAAGVYVDGTASGMFTATASLTAHFDVDGDGTADAGDYTLSGSIHDFKDTAGTYLGNDTAAHPNDPVSGGDNDWVVLLTAADLTGNTASAVPADGAITRTGGAAGSADGVLWAGDWNAQLYGAGDTVEDAVAPTGVAGSFRAISANIGGDGAGDNPPAAYKGVVGAFGATQDE